MSINRSMTSEKGDLEHEVLDVSLGPDLDSALRHATAGIGHSAKQVHAWLDDWATGNKRPIPSPDLTSDA